VGGIITSPNVTFNSADDWTIALAGVSGSQRAWQEPAPTFAGVNIVAFDVNSPNQLGVTSDVPLGSQGIPDGTPDTMTFSLNGGPLTVTFFDKGDVATAPDCGSTLGLLSLSVVALLGATRLRFPLKLADLTIPL
jgi:hypothetical protein